MDSSFFDILLKSAGKKPGLWDNIRAKRARGERAAKPGDKGYPDKKQWNRLTKGAADKLHDAKKAMVMEYLKKFAASPVWQRSEGKNPEGGLNAKGRASYNRETGGNLKAPVTESKPSGERASRRSSFCARMCGHKRKNTGAATKSDPDSRVNKALRKWRCKCGEELYKKALLNIISGDLEKIGGMPNRPGLATSRAFSKPTKIKQVHDIPQQKPQGFVGGMYGEAKNMFNNMYSHMKNADPNAKSMLTNKEYLKFLGSAPKMYSSLLGGDMERLKKQYNSFGAGLQ
jgi:hypothetical protein